MKWAALLLAFAVALVVFQLFPHSPWAGWFAGWYSALTYCWATGWGRCS
jgi:hypothetical protein